MTEQLADLAASRPPLARAANDHQPSVLVSLSKDDPTVLTALIDRTASQKRILVDLKRALPQFAVPCRELEKGIVDAILIKLRENITFEAASICVFGDSKFGRTIRYWRNRWEVR
jgi:hypothetical protein